MPGYPLIPALGTDGGPPVPTNRILLLEGIAETGSIGQAAKAAGLSYRAAWTALEELNTLSRTPLVSTVVGGKGGGGASLTQAGRNLVTVYRALEAMQRKLLNELEPIADAAVSLDTLHRMMLKTSARNQLHGTVRRIVPGTVNDTVELALDGGDALRAAITRESTELLALQPGTAAVALVKASWVGLQAGHVAAAKAAQNALHGVVESRGEGDRRAEVRVRLVGGGLIVALSDAAEGHAVGEAVTALVDEASVIVGVAH
ncbi:TOBE domain-containing protein [Chitinimonas koreensis]|uniref:TOBE domain-containing protein n=1 Tax=Chitinimonas koreensis TaxID=356302 RepID=UPI0003F86AB7|nr:TOBE domain-containing protein [Chitinimonas koreensis]QNM94666.1 TOBE domain-containing protein [Chitinimonas koreensis]